MPNIVPPKKTKILVLECLNLNIDHRIHRKNIISRKNLESIVEIMLKKIHSKFVEEN
jgi:hypothetical protein